MLLFFFSGTAIFIEHLRQLILSQENTYVGVFRPAALSKTDSNTGTFLWILRNFYRRPLAAALHYLPYSSINALYDWWTEDKELSFFRFFLAFICGKACLNVNRQNASQSGFNTFLHIPFWKFGCLMLSWRFKRETWEDLGQKNTS